VDDASCLNRQRGEMGVGGEIASLAYFPEKTKEQTRVTCSRLDDAHDPAGQLRLHVGSRHVHRHRIREDSRTRPNPDKA
jgi:hypothetical protein